jgi:multiple antibiotic resistance protein
MEDWRTYAEIAVALFVIADPIGAIPLFITLTHSHTVEERQRVAAVSAMSVALVLVSSVFVGEPVLHFFGINIPSFRVGGGILILMMAVAMLLASPSRTQRTPEEMAEAKSKEEIAVVPLAVPLVAGPGAISTVIIYAHQATTWMDSAYLTLISILVATTVWLALRLADPIRELLGNTGINVVTRLLGVILTAVAVGFITSGLAQLLPGLAGPR